MASVKWFNFQNRGCQCLDASAARDTCPHTYIDWDLGIYDHHLCGRAVRWTLPSTCLAKLNFSGSSCFPSMQRLKYKYRIFYFSVNDFLLKGEKERRISASSCVYLLHIFTCILQVFETICQLISSSPCEANLSNHSANAHGNRDVWSNLEV